MPYVSTGLYGRRWVPETQTKTGPAGAFTSGAHTWSPEKKKWVTGEEAAAETGEKVPVYDISRIRALQQEEMAPGLSELRREQQRVRAGRYRTPQERALALREAARGGGEGISALQTGALRSAQSLYAPEYQREMLEWQRRMAEKEKAEAEAETQAGVGGTYLGASGYLPRGILPSLPERTQAPRQAPSYYSYRESLGGRTGGDYMSRFSKATGIGF